MAKLFQDKTRIATVKIKECEKMKKLVDYYNCANITKTIKQIVINHFEVIKELEEVKTENHRLNITNNVILSKIKNNSI